MKVFKKILIGFGLLVALVVFIKAIFATYNWYQARQWYAKTDAFLEALQKPFKEDTHGGKTPEETWAMYVDAVKKRDIDLASKYVDAGHQQKEKEFFQRELKNNYLNIYIDQISNPLKKSSNIPDFLAANRERAYYFYQFKYYKTGQIETFNVNFYLNPLTGVWKILY